MIFQSLIAKLGFDTKEWTSGAASAKKDAKSLNDEFKNTLATLKEYTGKGSILGTTLKLAAGGGAVAALSMAANRFAQLGESVGEASMKMRAGELSGNQLATSIAFSIPIVGALARGFDGLHEAITGERAAAEKAAADARKWDVELKGRLQLQREYASATKETTTAMVEAAARRNRETAAIGEKDPLEADRNVARIKFLDAMEEQTKKRNEAFKKAGADDDSLKMLRDKIEFGHGRDARLAEGELEEALKDRRKIEEADEAVRRSLHNQFGADLQKIQDDQNTKMLEKHREVLSERLKMENENADKVRKAVEDQKAADDEKTDSKIFGLKRELDAYHGSSARFLRAGEAPMMAADPGHEIARKQLQVLTQIRDGQKRTTTNVSPYNESPVSMLGVT